MDTDRTTAMGLWTDAKEMSAAARFLRESKQRGTTIPAYFLLSRSIELILKSHLLAKGETHDYLKNRIGHNLVKARNRVRKNTNDKTAAVLDRYVPHIKLLNGYYMAKQF